jgi:hypothetical protein
MRVFRYATLATALAAVLVSVGCFESLFAQPDLLEESRPSAIALDAVDPVPEESFEVQTSGPIHEAFATPLTTDVPESIVVARKPPEPIQEVPPEERPEGQNIIWVPGYFAWDEQREDFIWMSGFWREVPPKRVWVAGYWAEAEGGWQWVPGFWTASDVQEVSYLPEPPETIEQGPSIEQPSENHFWVPGNWAWDADHYDWQPGYWARIQPDWVWVPAHYVWCPSGYVFVSGYWDVPVVRRGCLFAPVYFQPIVYQRHYHFTPRICWSTHLLTHHLWVRPSYYHYYFGDYYADRYADWGIRPWYLSFTFGRTSYDPLFSYYRWHHRDRDWDREVRTRHDHYVRNESLRPPRTYRDLERIVERGGNREVLQNAVVAAPINQIANRTTVNNVTANIINTNFRTPFRFERVAQQERRQFARQADELRNVVRQRRQLETRDNVARVEDAKREGAKKGEDTRVRRAAPRTLNIANVAQAIDATPGTRGPDTKARRPRDLAGGDRDDQPGDRRGDITDRARDRVRPDANRPDIARPDATRPDIARPEVAQPDVVRPDAKGTDIGGAARTRPGRVRPDVTRPDVARPDVTRTDRIRPEVTTPDVARPGTVRPDVARPDATRPDRIRPDVTRPDISRPDRIRPDAARPDVTRPDVTRPGTIRPDAGVGDGARPDVTRPNTIRPDTSRPRIPQPDVARPRVTQPDVIRPDAARPSITRPDVARPGATRPGVVQPDAIRPDVSRPNATRPDAVRPDVIRPDRAPLERGKGRSGRTENAPILRQGDRINPSAAPSARTSTPPSAIRTPEVRPDRANPVAPLRLGGPTPSARAAQAPRTEARPTAPSRASSDAARAAAKERAAEARKRDKDKD